MRAIDMLELLREVADVGGGISARELPVAGELGYLFGCPGHVVSTGRILWLVSV